MHVATDSALYRFGPFELDAGLKRLTRSGEYEYLPERYFQLLLVLVANAGRLLDKQWLTNAVWKGAAIGDNSIVQAVSTLRQTLGQQANGQAYIDTERGKGYRFTAPVECVPSIAGDPPPLDLNQTLEVYEAFVHGRAWLERLTAGDVVRACEAFAGVVVAEPRFAGGHIGMANACLLRYEMSRADLAPDYGSLAQAYFHAQEGCRYAARSGDALSVLAVVLSRLGNHQHAVAAAQKAVQLAPHDWRHRIRLALVSWGPERLREAIEVLDRSSDIAAGHWLAGTVYVARQDWVRALEHSDAGCAVQDRQEGTGTFATPGLHLQRAYILAATGEAGDDSAEAEARRELEFEGWRHVYSREICAHAWYLRGWLYVRRDQFSEAAAAFEETNARVSGHVLAHLSLAFVKGEEPDLLRFANMATDNAEVIVKRALEVATVKAAMLVLGGRHADAADMWRDAFLLEEPSQHGWLLPVEPLLHVNTQLAAWARALAALRDRAI